MRLGGGGEMEKECQGPRAEGEVGKGRRQSGLTELRKFNV